MSFNLPAQKILVVDDDEGARELADLVLTQAGYAVLRASSGDEAMALLGRIRPDLVLLDINMPVASGIDVLQRMNKARLRVPVVMMTANGDQASVWAAMEFGAVDYLLKPFTPQALAARVRKTLDAARDASALKRTFRRTRLVG
jgi:DNA-binding response OmpR family regulator